MKDRMTIPVGMGPKISWEQQCNSSLHVGFSSRTIIMQITVKISDIKVLRVFGTIHAVLELNVHNKSTFCKDRTEIIYRTYVESIY